MSALTARRVHEASLALPLAYALLHPKAENSTLRYGNGHPRAKSEYTNPFERQFPARMYLDRVRDGLPAPRLNFMSRISVGVEMTARFCTMLKCAHHSRASAPAPSATSGEMNRGSTRRSTASISGSRRASIRDGACGVTSPAVGVLRVPPSRMSGRPSRLPGWSAVARSTASGALAAKVRRLTPSRWRPTTVRLPTGRAVLSVSRSAPVPPDWQAAPAPHPVVRPASSHPRRIDQERRGMDTWRPSLGCCTTRTRARATGSIGEGPTS